MHAGRYVWTQRNLGEDYWEATIQRVAPLRDAAYTHEALLHCAWLFTDLGPAARRTLAQAAVRRVYGPGAAIVEQGMTWPNIGFVVSGSVTAMVGTETGRDYYLYEAFPFDIFGEIQALNTGGTIARTRPARQRPRPCRYRATSCSALPTAMEELSRRFAELCAQRARLLHEMLYARMTKPTVNRLAAAILPYATRTEGLAAVLPPLPSMTQAQLAALTGTVKDVIGREQSTALRAAGAIDLCGGRIARIDEARLRHFL